MNKTKKVVAFAVGVVMAGSLAMSFTACGGGGSSGKVVDPTVDESGNLIVSKNTKLNLSIGYNSESTGIAYWSQNTNVVGDGAASLMGHNYRDKDLKPAWDALQTVLSDGLGQGTATVEFNDVWSHSTLGQSSSNLNQVKTVTKYANVDIFTANVNRINEEALSSKTLLNLAEYLDFMPNYKAFLEANPVVQMSLLASSTGDMYVAPYFDGNDDIEKFVLLRKDIVERMLDDNLASIGDSTFKKQGNKNLNVTSTSAEPFMTASYSVDVTDPSVLTVSGSTLRYGNNKDDVTSNATTKVYVSYEAAKAAATTNETSELKTAIETAIGGTSDYNGTGNIVDIMNYVINTTQGDVSGTNLTKILRAYIDVAYRTAEGTEGESFYSETNSGLRRSEVFNSACAAWDADLYTALGRCYVASGSMFNITFVAGGSGKDVNYLVSGRTNSDQRTSDLYSLAGELYGARGLESRNNFTYFTSDGTVKDARANENTWDALDRMGALAKEGLINIGYGDSDANNTGIAGGDYGSHDAYNTLSLHDYVQTQTGPSGFKSDVNTASFNLAPVLTPVSLWDTDDDATTAPEIMRFTESWRGVKTDGIAVPKRVAQDANKLAAVLAFIDYFYSVDGQLLMTYGPRSTTGNTSPDGLWYATEQTAVSVTDTTKFKKITDATNYAPAQYQALGEEDAAENATQAEKDALALNKRTYFAYQGKVYTGNTYKDKNIPILTTENIALFHKTLNSFTNHARQNLGTCLPVGNKDQGFEYSCTADCGLVGSDIFNLALNNGTVKHPSQQIPENEADRDYWYILVPTFFPYSTLVTRALQSGTLQYIYAGEGTNTIYGASSSSHTNTMVQFIKNGGYGGSLTINGQTINVTSASTIITSHNNLSLNTLVGYKQIAWQSVLDWYEAKLSADAE